MSGNGSTLLPAITPGVGTGSQINSQCIIYASGSSVTQSGTDYTLTLNIYFLPAFTGKKIVYAATQTTTGGNTGWQDRGSCHRFVGEPDVSHSGQRTEKLFSEPLVL